MSSNLVYIKIYTDSEGIESTVRFPFYILNDSNLTLYNYIVNTI